MDDVFGRTRFAGIELLTAPGRVMTPRSTTEPLIERAVALIGDAPARVADIGSGSGAIAIAIALGAPNAEVWAADLSPAAVELARANVARCGLADRVTVLQGDLLDAVPGELDLVVANLPYLPEDARGELRYADLGVEPLAAVFAAGNGLGPYRRLLEACEERLREGGSVLIQYRGGILEGSQSRLAELLGELEERALAA
jgi:release factor glutamine methyltransferase